MFERTDNDNDNGQRMIALAHFSKNLAKFYQKLFSDSVVSVYSHKWLYDVGVCFVDF